MDGLLVPKSETGKGFTYCINQEKYLKVFLEDGNVPADKNAAEAKANNLKPYNYFEFLLTEIPKHMEDTNLDFLDDLLPWAEKLPLECKKQNRYFLSRHNWRLYLYRYA